VTRLLILLVRGLSLGVPSGVKFPENIFYQKGNTKSFSPQTKSLPFTGSPSGSDIDLGLIPGSYFFREI
jgi:hypothetical protein